MWLAMAARFHAMARSSLFWRTSLASFLVLDTWVVSEVHLVGLAIQGVDSHSVSAVRRFLQQVGSFMFGVEIHEHATRRCDRPLHFNFLMVFDNHITLLAPLELSSGNVPCVVQH